MTFAVFVLVFIAAWTAVANETYFIAQDVTVWQAAFIAVLSTATLFAIKSKDERNMKLAAILVANFCGSTWAFYNGYDAILSTAGVDFVTAAFLVLWAVRKAEFACAGIYVASVFASILTAFGFIPDASERPLVFIALSHPDVTALLGHAASIILGLGAGDSGKRIRDFLGFNVRNWSMGANFRRSYPSFAAFVSSRKVAED